MSLFKAITITKIVLIPIQLFYSVALKADEGMWLISLANKNITQMQRMGFLLSAEDIYSINRSSLKDAVVLLDDGGCSAELISPNGLLLTNHHCATSDIQYHSTPSNNLLNDGYWASNYGEELYVPGKTALILNRVEDVTQRILSEVDYEAVDYFERVTSVAEMLIKKVETSEMGTFAKVIPMYNHNQFFLFVYNRFTDVRLAGAPPSSIGNFGGDVDNWRWPRHTGDFALYRIYTSPDGMPANYSKRNVPYKPKYHFPVSLQGVNEGDFTLVIGYPGTTHRYTSSFNAKHERDVVAPWVEEVWGEFIKSIKDAMYADMAMKVDFTDKHDILVNFWQKDTYQAQSMHRFNVVSRLKERDEQLKDWATEDIQSRREVLEALSTIEQYFGFLRENSYEELFRSLGSLINWPVQISDIIYELHDLIIELMAEKPAKRKVRRETRRLKKEIEQIFEAYYPNVDLKLYSAALLSFLEHLPDDVEDPILRELKQHAYLDLLIPIVVNQFYGNSYFTSPQRLMRFLENPVLDSLSSDPLFMLQLTYENYISTIQDAVEPYSIGYKRAMRDYSRGILEMQVDRLHYPDANSSMRFSFGKVAGFIPRDGIRFKHTTYLEGKIEKEDQNNEVFKISPRIKELWNAKDFTPYADEIGVPVCFITDNDITNGNSGSPVLNALGHLVGVAFDGNYEAMACDFLYEPTMQRTIVTDIRYVLFVIDKFAGAKHLIDEMTIVEP